MCGIWGIFSKTPQGWLNQSEMDITKTMMVISSLRGDHSTGACIIPQYNSISKDCIPIVGKTVGGPYQFLHTKQGQDYIKYALSKGSSIFGHNRYATKGSIKVSNAHPFEEGDWIMVHNGTIHTGLDLKGEVEVDSHALCHRINEVGIKDALLSINGAYAILAYNKQERKMYAARNSQRPLWSFTNDGKVFVMSLQEDLIYTLEKHNRFFYSAPDTKTPEEFKEDRLYVLGERGFEDIDSLKDTKSVYTWPSTAEVPKATERYEYDRPVGKTITFLVDTVVQKGSQYVYHCLGEGSYTDVVFITDKNYPELIGQCGEAPVHLRRIERSTNKVIWHVKFRQITWPVPESPVKETTCEDCGDVITDLETAVKMPYNEKYICAACVSEWVKRYGHVPIAGLMQ
jgi:hypothetical protein